MCFEDLATWRLRSLHKTADFMGRQSLS